MSDLTQEAGIGFPEDAATGIDPQGAAETTAVPNMFETELAELAWSHEDAWADVSTSKEKSVTGGRTAVRWVTAIAAVLATAAAAGWLGAVLYREDHSAPPVKPPAASPTSTKTPAPPPVASPPPTTMPPPAVLPPPERPVANVNAQTVALFRSLLARDGLHENTNDIEGIRSFAQRVCGDAAAGNLGPPTAYTSPVPGNTEPPNWAEHALDDTLRAFCPQYA